MGAIAALTGLSVCQQRCAVLTVPGAGAVDQPRRNRTTIPRPARPTASSASDAGSGTLPVSENAALNVGGVAPPTISVPTRNQSGAIPPGELSRVQLWRSGLKGVPSGETIGLGADSQRKFSVGSVTSTCGTKK